MNMTKFVKSIEFHLYNIIFFQQLWKLWKYRRRGEDVTGVGRRRHAKNDARRRRRLSVRRHQERRSWHSNEALFHHLVFWWKWPLKTRWLRNSAKTKQKNKTTTSATAPSRIQDWNSFANTAPSRIQDWNSFAKIKKKSVRSNESHWRVSSFSGFLLCPSRPLEKKLIRWTARFHNKIDRISSRFHWISFNRFHCLIQWSAGKSTL